MQKFEVMIKGPTCTRMIIIKKSFSSSMRISRDLKSDHPFASNNNSVFDNQNNLRKDIISIENYHHDSYLADVGQILNRKSLKICLSRSQLLVLT